MFAKKLKLEKECKIRRVQIILGASFRLKDLANEEMAVCGLLSSDLPLSWSNIVKLTHWKKTKYFS